MNYINIFNVKHGDFGIFHDQGNYMCILDCGSSQSKSGLKTACTTPVNLIDLVSTNFINYKHKELLISHYHDDHYNCINAFNKISQTPVFENMYLPYIKFEGKYFHDENKLIGQINYSYCLLNSLTSSIKPPFKTFKNYQNLFKNKYAINHIYLHKNYQFKGNSSYFNKSVKVLWPPQYAEKKSYKLDKVIKDIEESLKKNDKNGIIQKAKIIFNNSIIEIDNNMDSSESNIDEYIDDFKYVKPEEKEKVIPDSYKILKNALQGVLDALSIVLEFDNNLLWMGDITNNVLLYISGDFKKKYKYIKLPHHGTRDFSVINTKASKYIVSLSDGKHYSGKEYQPIFEKNIDKASNDNSIILCTDGHKDCMLQYKEHLLPFLTSQQFPICRNNTKITIPIR